MANFLHRFFEHTKHEIELRTVPMLAREFSRNSKVLENFIVKHRSSNLFFGCATRENKDGTKQGCREIPALWLDIDFKEISEPEVVVELGKFQFTPSITIASGGGLHVYWLLKEPHDAHDPRCEQILRGLASVLHGDRQATDISRILRVPGTLNHKYNPPREVKIIQQNWDARYNLTDFDAYEEVVPPEVSAETRTGQIKPGGRTKALVSMAGFMNRRGHPIEEIEAALLGLNARFNPPFAESEVRRKAKSVFNGYAKQHGATNGKDPIAVSIEHYTADHVEPEPLKWLWENRIPSGKLTVFFGMPDTGKSTVAIDIASRCTTGAPWPDVETRRDPCDVLMLISEDDLKDTVVPRLMAAGAKLDQIHFAIQTIAEHSNGNKTARRIAFDTDLKALESMLVQNPEIKLVIVDPLGSYLGKLKKNAEEEIRWVLTELKELAERVEVAVLSIDFFNKKNDQSGLQRLSGAGALAAVPRAVWAFVKDTDDKMLRLMLNAKLNVVAEAKKEGLKYYSVGIDISIKDVQSSTPVIQWCGASQGDLDEILHIQADPEKGKRGKAGKWLLEHLAGGRKRSPEVYDAAATAGFSARTIKNAMRDIGTASVKTKGGWYMEMPNNEDA